MTGRRERVIKLLRSHSELCSMGDFYAGFLSNARNDISTLKSQGWDITSFWIAHGKTQSHCHYRLIKEPKPEQLSIA